MEKLLEVKDLNISFHTYAGEVRRFVELILTYIKGKP